MSDCTKEKHLYERYYIGVKMISAWPEKKDGKEGYSVQYLDGYTSWSPKEIFEKAYFPMDDDNTKVTEGMVNAFVGDMNVSKFDEKTTLVAAETVTGFRQVEVSSCVDPKNYDQELGAEIAGKRIKDTIWRCLGFVLQWANYGLYR